MRRMHRVIVSTAGLVLAAGTALGTGSPAGAATAAAMDFPTQFSEGFLVNVNSGKCLQPSWDDPFSNGDIVVQATCDGTVSQAWELVPLGTKTFIPGTFFHVTHPGYQIKSAATGLCLDDRDGVSSDGATVQEWACNTTSTTMQWGGFLSSDGSNLVANVRASNNRGSLITLEIPAGSRADQTPVLLFADTAQNPPPAQEFQYSTTG